METYVAIYVTRYLVCLCMYTVCVYTGVTHFNFLVVFHQPYGCEQGFCALVMITTNHASRLAQDTSSCGSSDYGSKYVKVVTL